MDAQQDLSNDDALQQLTQSELQSAESEVERFAPLLYDGWLQPDGSINYARYRQRIDLPPWHGDGNDEQGDTIQRPL